MRSKIDAVMHKKVRLINNNELADIVKLIDTIRMRDSVRLTYQLEVD